MHEQAIGHQVGFRPDKVSGTFDYQQIYSRSLMRSMWENVYAEKQQDAGAGEDQGEITEKHLMYYNVFRNLGFFNLSRQQEKPIILQAGVGHGKTLRTVISKMESVKPLGLDISFLSLVGARKNGLEEVVQGDIFPLPFPNDSIDAVFEVGVVEHLYTSDPFIGKVVDRLRVVESFQELKRVLKSGGKVGFIQPSKHSVLPLSKTIDQIFGRWAMGFQEDFGLNDFCQLVTLGGFSDIHFSVVQAPDDFPARIKYGDRILKSLYTMFGQYRKTELTGALFAIVATKE